MSNGKDNHTENPNGSIGKGTSELESPKNDNGNNSKETEHRIKINDLLDLTSDIENLKTANDKKSDNETEINNKREKLSTAIKSRIKELLLKAGLLNVGGNKKLKYYSGRGALCFKETLDHEKDIVVKFQRINENRSENWENLTVETVTKFFMLFSQHRNSFSPDREMAASGNTRTVTESIVSLFADVQIKKDDTRRVISIIDKESRTFGCFWDGEQAREINQIEDIQQSGNVLDKSLVDGFSGNCVECKIATHDFLIKRLMASLLSKRFLILSGLAGSGKTKLAQAFAMWLCKNENQYAVIPVGADWTGNENILGYPDGLNPESYVSKPALDLLLRAGEDETNPYFLILDEMNLSHVERYFADVLSSIESGGYLYLHSGGERTSTGGVNVPAQIPFPENVFVIGTVNVDETTYMFSPKVLDRANVMEFRMSHTEMKSFLSKESPKANLEGIKGNGSKFASAFVEKSKNDIILNFERENFESEMLNCFSLLEKYGSEYGYRVAYEAARFLQNYKDISEDQNNIFNDAMDCILVQKILPKLHGSRAKLGRLLKALYYLCFVSDTSKAADTGADPIVDVGSDGGKEKQLLHEAEVFAADPKRTLESLNEQTVRFPLSKEKIGRMYRLMAENGFTSFAEA